MSAWAEVHMQKKHDVQVLMKLMRALHGLGLIQTFRVSYCLEEPEFNVVRVDMHINEEKII